MKQKALKLILSGAATLALAVSLTATTFAYVLIGNNVTVEEFDFNVETQEGLLISLDGINFSQDITSDQLKAAIAGSVEDYEKNRIVPTTVKQSFGEPVIENGKVIFEKEQINYIKATDTYERSYVEATRNKDYISFPLYFQIEGTPTASNYNLAFGESTYLKANTTDVELVNSFDVYEYQSSGENADIYKKKSYYTGTIQRNFANAMRLGIYNEDLTNPLSVYEITDEYDLGSAAINGRTDAKHDPYSSVMINYYNKIFHRYPFKMENTTKKDIDGNLLQGVYGAEDGSAFDTIASFGTTNGNGDFIGNTVAPFTKNSNNQFEILEITVYIWLEGWDADNIPDLRNPEPQIKSLLEFTLQEA